jgi:DNA ligase-1
MYQQSQLSDASPAVELTIQLCPDYMGIELGIGEMLLVKAIAESTGRATTKIKEDLRKEGDLGKVAMVSPIRSPPDP